MDWGLQLNRSSPQENGENGKKVRLKHHSSKSKKPATPHGYWLSGGGELGIRTLGPLRDTAFRVLHHRPLGQLSKIYLNIQLTSENGENGWGERRKYEIVKPRKTQ